MNVKFGFGFVLCLVVSLVGTNIYAARVLVGADASIISSTNVNSTFANYWDSISGGNVGSAITRIARAGLYIKDSKPSNMSAYLATPGNVSLSRLVLKERLKFISQAGMLIGIVAVDLAVSTGGDTEPLSVIVTYN